MSNSVMCPGCRRPISSSATLAVRISPFGGELYFLCARCEARFWSGPSAAGKMLRTIETSMRSASPSAAYLWLGSTRPPGTPQVPSARFTCGDAVSHEMFRLEAPMNSAQMRAMRERCRKLECACCGRAVHEGCPGAWIAPTGETHLYVLCGECEQKARSDDGATLARVELRLGTPGGRA